MQHATRDKFILSLAYVWMGNKQSLKRRRRRRRRRRRCLNHVTQ
jgi:hypothetical protein